jgi:chromosome segregation ATPase
MARAVFLTSTSSQALPGFDRTKVEGPATTLISLEEQHFNKPTAVEIATGISLYNIVAENEQVRKDPIKNGRLRKRITIIPPSKIMAYKLPAKVSYFPFVMHHRRMQVLTSSMWKSDAANCLAPGKVY